MADDKPEKEEEVTPKRAVEVDEKDLDQAAGGAYVDYFNKPADSLSLNFTKEATQKVSPTLTPGTAPGAVTPIETPDDKI